MKKWKLTRLKVVSDVGDYVFAIAKIRVDYLQFTRTPTLGTNILTRKARLIGFGQVFTVSQVRKRHLKSLGNDKCDYLRNPGFFYFHLQKSRTL